MPNIKPEQIAAQARTWLGTHYHHQGRLKKSERGKGGRREEESLIYATR